MLLPLAHLGSSQAMMSPHAGFVVTLKPLYVSMGATTSVRLLNDCNTFEQTLRHHTRTGFSIGLHIVFLVFSALLTCALFLCFTCSQPFVFAFSGSLLSTQAMDRLSSSASTASSIDDYSEHNMWNPQLELLFLEHVNGIVDSYLVDLDLVKIAFSCHFVLDFTLLQGRSVRLYTMIHCTPLSMEFLVGMAPLPSAGQCFPNFAVFRKLVMPSFSLFSAIEVPFFAFLWWQDFQLA